MPDEPEMTTVLVAVATILLTKHFWMFLPDLKRFFRMFFGGKGNEDSKERIEAAFQEASIQHYLHTAQMCAHLTAVFLCGRIMQWIWTANSDFDHVQCCTMIGAWIFIYLLTTGVVSLSLNRVRLLHVVGNVLLIGWLPGQFSKDIVTTTAARVGGRFSVAMTLMDIKATIPAQLLFSLAELQAASHFDPGSFYGMVLVQMCHPLIIIATMGLIEFSTRSRIAMLIDSESMVSSFRRMLRGVCDGELLLDEHLQILGNADCLTKLLMTHNISGDFEQLLVDGDRARFRHFIADIHQNSAQATPPCLRLSLELDEVRVAVDLFHVRVSPLLGEARHLLAFREDAESRLRQEARAARHEVPRMLDRSPRRARTTGSARSCASDVSALLQICHELQEMTLLVDTSTTMLDVEQAHLSFSRDSAEDSMPSLRRIVQPTDWPGVRDLLVDFSRSQSELPASERTVLRTKLRLREGRRCIAARRVEVSTYSSPLKLHMHLSRVRLETHSKHEGALPELYEHSESDVSD